MAQLVKRTFSIQSAPWKTLDPFLFCVHHKDDYPAGTLDLGPDPKLLRGRDIGSDFSGKDGWSMYHGEVVPGFPEHPHRGFETITVTRKGLIDHFDSMGAKGRYGIGDTQWMTAGKGVQHCEMFPLLKNDQPNPCELFQIWLNLPKRSKFVDPDYKMIWAEDTPILKMPTGETTVRVIASDPKYFGATHPDLKIVSPPSNSYAADPAADLAIWEINIKSGGSFKIPPAIGTGVNRVLYFFDGKKATIGSTALASPKVGAELDSTQEATVSAVDGDAQFLMMQGRPIGEPVAQYGPFVMNTQEEIAQAFSDFRRTRFGGWPWDRPDPTNGNEPKRFAQHSNGSIERPPN